MKIKIFPILITALLLTLAVHLCVSGSEIIPSNEYRPETSDEIPNVLGLYTDLTCGPFTIRLAAQPILTKSGLGIIADLDMKYLILRLNIANNSEETIGWLTPDTFVIRETYLGQIYGTYRPDPVMSAKIAAGYHLPAFFTPIESGKSIQTTIVFSVFPDVQNWILTFAPKVFGDEDAPEEVRVCLPKPIVQ